MTVMRSPSIAEVGSIALGAGPVDDRAVADDHIVCHVCPLVRCVGSEATDGPLF